MDLVLWVAINRNIVWYNRPPYLHWTSQYSQQKHSVWCWKVVKWWLSTWCEWIRLRYTWLFLEEGERGAKFRQFIITYLSYNILWRYFLKKLLSILFCYYEDRVGMIRVHTISQPLTMWGSHTCWEYFLHEVSLQVATRFEALTANIVNNSEQLHLNHVFPLKVSFFLPRRPCRDVILFVLYSLLGREHAVTCLCIHKGTDMAFYYVNFLGVGYYWRPYQSINAHLFGFLFGIPTNCL